MFLYSPDGRPVEKYQAYENALGIKSVSWSPTSQFLSIGSYDQQVKDNENRRRRKKEKEKERNGK